jgi:hypothetical protein
MALSILEEAYRLKRRNELTRDCDIHDTESLYLEFIDLSPESIMEFKGLVKAQNFLNRAVTKEDTFLTAIQNINIEPEEFPLYLLNQEPEEFSCLLLKESQELLASAEVMKKLAA